MNKKNVLFICTGNAARSQMAEALLRHYGGDRYTVYSAGTRPGTVSPLAKEVINELGISMEGQYSKSVADITESDFDIAVTVCDQAQEQCPFILAKKVIHKGFEDPAQSTGTRESKLAVFRRIRDQILSWIKENFQLNENIP